jgi:HEAT repeat protein
MRKYGGLPGRVWQSPLLTACCLFLAAACLAQRPSTAPPGKAPPVQAPDNESGEQSEAPLPGDWAAELLDAILSAPNAEAADTLFRATFAAGQSIIPQLAEALKDDRTAEYAAQSLAFIGGEQAIQALWKLQEDKRDLNLRRFYYGALAEYDTDQATQTLFQVINKSDSEPDRTVTEAAILALTVRTDSKVADLIRQAEKKVSDVVIRDDLENALDVIQIRSKYLSTPEGKKAGGSIDAAVRTYFIPALQPPPPSPSDVAAHRAPAKPDVKVEMQNLTFSPDRQRALAAVTLEDPSAVAKYDLVMQKRLGNWEVVSVWMGAETEKLPPPQPSRPSKE